MSECVTLRTLTRKSKLKFGKFPDLTIQDLINIGRKEYLRWIYCHSSMISFTEDVLEEIGQLPSLRVSKPGKTPSFFIPDSETRKQLSQEEIYKFSAMKKKRLKESNKCNQRGIHYMNKPVVLQKSNHGR